MFICSECGTKYEIMPKFCDCGNDIFIEEQEQKTTDYTPQEEKPKRKGRGKVESFSPMAIGTFAFCLILSFVILFFIGNPKKDIITEDNPQTEVEEKIEIPSIDTFWDNTIAKVEQKEEIKEEPQEEKPIIEIMPKFVQNILPPEPVKKVQQPQKVQPIKNTPPQTKQQPKIQTQTPKTTTTVQQQTQKVNTQAQAVTNRVKNNIQYNNPTTTVQPNANKIPNINTTTNTTSASTKTTTTNTVPKTTITHSTAANTHNTTPAPTPVVRTKSQAELTKELNTYKAGLRNTIGKKIDFTKVVGDGDCTLSFKLTSGGKLTSRAFIKQSSNITLNDAVFSAMNSTTSYNPPPEGYKGQTLTLKIKFYNGNFEIILN